MVELSTLAKDAKYRMDLFESNLAKTLAGISNEGQNDFDCHLEFKR